MFSRKQNAPEDEHAAITASEKAFLYVRIRPAGRHLFVSPRDICGRASGRGRYVTFTATFPKCSAADFKLELIVAVARSIVSVLHPRG